MVKVTTILSMKQLTPWKVKWKLKRGQPRKKGKSEQYVFGLPSTKIQ